MPPLHKKSLDICMIVRDGAHTLPLILPNLISSADRVIVADTGSNDGSKELCRGMGAEVYDFEWCHDFSAARNFSISKADSDWIMVLDADEYAESQDLEKLRDYLDTCESDVISVKICECAFPGKIASTCWNREKIFLRSSGIRYCRAVNEQPEYSREIKKTFFEGLSIYHWGGDLPNEHMKKKLARRVEEFEKNIAGLDDFTSWYMYGIVCYKNQDLDKAIELFLQAIKIAEKTGQNELAMFRKQSCLTFIASCLYKLKRYDDAICFARKGLEIIEEDIECHVIISKSLYELERYEEAASVMLSQAKLTKKAHPVSGTRDIVWDFERYFVLAKAQLKLGRILDAKQSFKNISPAYNVAQVKTIIKTLDDVLNSAGRTLSSR